MRRSRSSCSEVFCKKGVLINFTKFIGKHLCQSFSSEVCNFIKKETLAEEFSCEFCEISKNTFLHRAPVVAASEGPALKKFIAKANRKKALKYIKNIRTFAADCVKKKGNDFFYNLNPLFVTDKKSFCKMIKPLFTNKGNYGSQIKLVEKDNDLIAKELNEFFKNAVAILNIKENSFINNSTPEDITYY